MPKTRQTGFVWIPASLNMVPHSFEVGCCYHSSSFLSVHKSYRICCFSSTSSFYLFVKPLLSQVSSLTSNHFPLSNAEYAHRVLQSCKQGVRLLPSCTHGPPTPSYFYLWLSGVLVGLVVCYAVVVLVIKSVLGEF